MPPPPLYEERFIEHDDPHFPSCHASTIVELPGGDLLAAWYAGSREMARDVAIISARLPMGARHWSRPQVIADTLDRSEGNPVLFVGPYGTVFLVYVTMQGDGWDTCQVKVKTSCDGGHAWDAERILQPAWGWMTRNKPIVLPNGDIVLPMYNERDWHSFMLISEDGGQTWLPGGEIRNEYGVIQPTLALRRDGSVITFLRRGARDPEQTLWQSLSRDGGRTWSPPERADLPNPNAAVDVVRLANGHFVLAFNSSRTERRPLSLALSTNDGRDWPAIRDLETASGEYSYPAISQGADGRIHVTYTWRRQRIRHVTVNEAWILAGGG
ncbi:MAG: exo-alpha-sialidase [Armatimonadetes bacterium]|nr:exo-alpha-sialidase [Armatimonadota bacterium]